MKFQSLFVNLLISLASLCIFILLTELILHFAVPFFKPRFTKVDSGLGWFHYPFTEDIKEIEGHVYQLGYNSHGYRMPGHTYAKPESVSRIVILGDSFVDGSEVGDEETFTWHLQTHLKDIEVINLGVYGYSTTQELITLERVGLQFDPDLVILMTMTNDYTDNLLNVSFYGPRPRYVLNNGSLEFEGTNHPLTQEIFKAANLPILGMEFLHRSSYFYYFVNHYLYQPMIADRIDSIILEQKNALDEQDRKELYFQLVTRMKELCDDSGITFLVVFAYPKKYLVENTDSPSLEICEQLTTRGIVNFDLFNILKKKELQSDKSLYYETDFHWNPTGHKFIFEVLGEWVRSWKKKQLNHS